MRSIGILVCLLSVSPAAAHYHLLIPDKHSVKSGEEVTLTYMFGHPYEHQMFDAAEPASALIFAPDGEPFDMKAKLKKVQVPGADKKMVTAYRLMFKPENRGDYIVSFTSPAVKHEGEKIPMLDTVKVVLHVQTQHGWDTNARTNGQQFDLMPLTRPYGLQPGMLFRAAFQDIGAKPSPVASAEVEVERYNPEPPKKLPPEEHITYSARTDEKGVLAVTLPDPGWWAVTAIQVRPEAIHRFTYWVPVDDKIPLKPAE